MLSFGFDIHGVIDTNPEFFAKFSKILVDAGCLVHIISGPTFNTIVEEVNRYGISHTHIFSIVDYCEAQGYPVTYDDTGPHVDPYYWDKAKGEYAKQYAIDLHFDDSDVYRYFFKTPYARFFSRDTERVRKQRV